MNSQPEPPKEVKPESYLSKPSLPSSSRDVSRYSCWLLYHSGSL